MKSTRILLAVLALLGVSQAIQTDASRKEARELLVYTGTYTGGGSRGIYVHRFNPTSGKITPVGLAAETSNPSFLAVHPNGRFLYAVNESENGTVSSFAIDRATGILKSLNKVSSRGSGPCHLALDRTGKWLFVANYNNGSIAVLSVHDDGTLGEALPSFERRGSGVNPIRQAGPHAHSVNISPDNQILLVADLGLDAIFRFEFDARKGRLTPFDSSAANAVGGSGPRHLTWSTNGKFVYVLNEMTSTVAAFTYKKETGRLQEIGSLALPADSPVGLRSSAEIVMHPGGKALYASMVQQQSEPAPYVVSAEVPVYPLLARHGLASGTVTVSYSVKAGKVISANSERLTVLSSAAIANVETWVFLPEVNGNYVTTFTYVLEGPRTTSQTNPQIELRLPTSLRITATPMRAVSNP